MHGSWRPSIAIGDGPALRGRRGLRLADRRGGPHRDAHHDLGAVRDAADDAAAAVREEALAVEHVVGLASRRSRASRSRRRSRRPWSPGSTSSRRRASRRACPWSGSPQPAGTPRATTSTTPPTESLSSRAASIALDHARRRPRRPGSAPGSPRPRSQSRRLGARPSPTWTVPPTIETPTRRERAPWRAAPAATRPTVSRPEAAAAAAVVADAVLLRRRCSRRARGGTRP